MTYFGAISVEKILVWLLLGNSPLLHQFYIFIGVILHRFIYCKDVTFKQHSCYQKYMTHLIVKDDSGTTNFIMFDSIGF